MIHAFAIFLRLEVMLMVCFYG